METETIRYIEKLANAVRNRYDVTVPVKDIDDLVKKIDIISSASWKYALRLKKAEDDGSMHTDRKDRPPIEENPKGTDASLWED